MKMANEKDYQEKTMKMKMYKQGEVSEVSDTLMANENPQAGMLKKYSHGEFSDAGGKSSNAKPDSWSTTKIKQGSFNS